MPRLEKMITFCGQPAKVACDANCEKAWGSNSRPTVQASSPGYRADNPDDYAFLADHELGDAPFDPGTCEGGQAKPNVPLERRTADMLNKWCVRECERSAMSDVGKSGDPLELPDFSVRFYNIRPHNRG